MKQTMTACPDDDRNPQQFRLGLVVGASIAAAAVPVAPFMGAAVAAALAWRRVMERLDPEQLYLSDAAEEMAGEPPVAEGEPPDETSANDA